MTFFDSVAEKVRKNDPLPVALRAALIAATPVFRAGMLMRAMRAPVKVDAHVISFGNLTVGGTGKTPAVIERAEMEIASGNRVAVLTRGYGATRPANGVVCVKGGDSACIADIIGDEPALIARRVANVVIARGTDRVATATECMARFACNVLILDDGFQYLRLTRDENILVVDAANPFGNGHLVPRGVLREPVGAAARADRIVLTHCDRVAPEVCRKLESQLSTICPGVGVRKTFHAPGPLYALNDNSLLPLESLRDRAVVAVCAIGSPERFAGTLRSLGAEIVEERFFRDHATIPNDALRSEHLVVTTEKNAVRLSGVPANVYVLGIRLADWND